MPLPQKKFREIVFQLLYSNDLTNSEEELQVPFIMSELAVTRRTMHLAYARMRELWQYKHEIDEWIKRVCIAYEFDRIQRVERNILRLGIFEILFDSQVPAKVAISEAMRLARKFSTPEAGSFVNALLDAIYQSTVGEKVDAAELSQKVDQLLHSEKIALEVSEGSCEVVNSVL